MQRKAKTPPSPGRGPAPSPSPHRPVFPQRGQRVQPPTPPRHVPPRHQGR